MELQNRDPMCSFASAGWQSYVNGNGVLQLETSTLVDCDSKQKGRTRPSHTRSERRREATSLMLETCRDFMI